jgi:HTH-type transcriptional regulator, quorum sensing regulator NprR
MNSSVGERLREARLASGLTQEELGRGVATKGFISLVERGRATPSLPKLRVLADRLGRPISFFFVEAPDENLMYLLKAAEIAIKAGEPQRSLALVDEAGHLQCTANERAELQRLRGMALCDLGRRADAVTSLQEASAGAPIDDPELSAKIYAELGYVLGLEEQFNAAAEANLRSLAWLDKWNQARPDLRAWVLTNLAGNCYSLGQNSQSATYLERALAAATDSESLLRMANAHMAMGITARAEGDLQGALRHCDRALELHHQIGQDRVANQILNNLGDAYFAAGRLADARAAQERCLRRAVELNDQVAVAAAAGELARYAVGEGSYLDAVSLAQRAIAAAIKAGDHVRQATSLAIEGTACEHLGWHGSADRRFRRALRLLAERQAAGKLADVCAMYSKVLSGRSEHRRALAFMQMAFQRNFDHLERHLTHGRSQTGGDLRGD